MGSKQSVQFNSLSGGETNDKQNVTVGNTVAPTAAIQRIDDFDELRLRKGFRQYASSNGLSRSCFHEALGILEELGLRRLRETPLGDRLFNCFDIDGDGVVQEDEFVNSAAILIGNDQNSKKELTFKAYASPKGVVFVGELLNILTQSWLSAFWFLSERLHQRSSDIAAVPSAQEIQAFASKNSLQFRESVLASLSPYLMTDEWQYVNREWVPSVSSPEQEKMYLDASNFSRWASEDRTISAEWDSVTVRVAGTLLNIETAPLYPHVH
ncbi:putative Recoverin family protein [Cardiosporidium cionae]|uniref:Recoverin family protein n=1 Tax=Cardiosporidium cionae TaxID=476202 RepID=A0ABQ7J903_9APIC|nr:putative Recoverin family protein [Cardiosporidium cionae]|eukprot:KAF8820443.1 putative Recoverin family protein [Cardiosporidium cionae]